MNDISSDDIFLLKQRLAEQEALIHALQEKLSNREREIDHLQAQLGPDDGYRTVLSLIFMSYAVILLLFQQLPFLPEHLPG